MAEGVTLFKILIVDDDRELRISMRTALSHNRNYFLEEAVNGLDALEKIEKMRYDLVLLDVDMPKLNGLETLKRIIGLDSSIIVIMITAYTNLKDAVQAVRDGAYNYISKPIKHGEINKIVEHAFEAHTALEEVAFSAPILKVDNTKEFVGKSSGMQKVFNFIHKLSKVDTTVLVRGESGTGKELVAKAIHLNSNQRADRFVAVNCSAIPENLLESELFGHEKGSFTGADQRKIGKFQYAEGGTIFLDEIGDLPVSMQVKLLRVIQEKTFTPVGSNKDIEVSVRIIAATNRNLEEMLKVGTFRDDLYYRLNVLPIFLPPLRERKDDIEPLIKYFIRKFNKVHGKNIKGVDPQVINLLKRYNWPGNIRELENIIERAFIIESTHLITSAGLPDVISDPNCTEPVIEGDMLDYTQMKERFEKEFIIKALKTFNGKINQTALNANIPKKTLLRKLEKYNINARDYRDN
ncbi:MAG: two-component system response regulator [Deltaproteobacteria bacterium RIFOXYA12_FULL_61_11]|nr:MAG: two-component system response regulator [Deltaproteobacteria bacterium RIFOXYA12_FULL_61_11]